MTLKQYLIVILCLSLFGVAFSGVLSYQELFEHPAGTGLAACGVDTVLGYPACIYGFFTYLLLAITTGIALGLIDKQPSPKI